MEDKLRAENRLLRQQVRLNESYDSRMTKNDMQSNHTLSDRLMLGGLINKTHNNKRDLYNVFGYDLEPSLEDFIARYKRQDIAKRIIDAYPKACWGSCPTISDDSDTQEKSVFEEAVSDLIKDKNAKLFHYLTRTDILAGLGHFSILFIGVSDGKSPDTPIDSTSLKSTDILFMAPYAEINVTITEYDEDLTSPRYGLPLIYNLQTGGYGALTGSDNSNMMPGKTQTVHYSRVIHVADGVLENDVFGTPRLLSVVNRLIDLEKIVGGGSESFFLNSRGGLHMNQQPETQLVDTDLLENRMEEFTHNLTRYLRTKGIDVNTLNFDIADPKNYFDVILALISSATGIPKRILTGSEQAQLASSQDENNWLTRVHERQIDFCENQLLRPMLDWYIRHGILPAPKNDDYTITWTDLRTISESERADIAVKQTQALAHYLNAMGAAEIMPPKQFFEEVLYMDYREDDLMDPQDFDYVEEPIDGQEEV